jgi:hypothetical protein
VSGTTAAAAILYRTPESRFGALKLKYPIAEAAASAAAELVDERADVLIIAVVLRGVRAKSWNS